MPEDNKSNTQQTSESTSSPVQAVAVQATPDNGNFAKGVLATSGSYLVINWLANIASSIKQWDDENTAKLCEDRPEQWRNTKEYDNVACHFHAAYFALNAARGQPDIPNRGKLTNFFLLKVPEEDLSDPEARIVDEARKKANNSTQTTFRI